jgi:hypothetical protein
MKRILIEVEIAEEPQWPHPEALKEDLAYLAREAGATVLQAEVYDQRDRRKPGGARDD